MDRLIKGIKGTARNTGNQIKSAISQFGKITSIGVGGKSINIQNVYDGEIRDASIVSPYGISSSSYGNISAQSIVNDFDNSVIVGVYDQNKPDVQPGELILYNKGKTRVILDINDNLTLTNGKVSMTLNNNGSIDIDGDNINMASSGAGISSHGSSITTTAQDMTMNVDDINMNGSNVDITGSVSIGGSMSINGSLSLNGGLTLSYGSSNITISESSITINSGTVMINGRDLS